MRKITTTKDTHEHSLAGFLVLTSPIRKAETRGSHVDTSNKRGNDDVVGLSQKPKRARKVSTSTPLTSPSQGFFTPSKFAYLGSTSAEKPRSQRLHDLSAMTSSESSPSTSYLKKPRFVPNGIEGTPYHDNHLRHEAFPVAPVVAEASSASSTLIQTEVDGSHTGDDANQMNSNANNIHANSLFAMSKAQSPLSLAESKVNVSQLVAAFDALVEQYIASVSAGLNEIKTLLSNRTTSAGLVSLGLHHINTISKELNKMIKYHRDIATHVLVLRFGEMKRVAALPLNVQTRGILTDLTDNIAPEFSARVDESIVQYEHHLSQLHQPANRAAPTVFQRFVDAELDMIQQPNPLQYSRNQSCRV